MDRYYRPGEILRPETDYLRTIEEAIGSWEGTRFVIAQDNKNRGIGLACVAILRPGRDLRGLLYLKDLYVAEGARGLGTGTRIMRFLAAFASENDIGRMDFTTDGNNAAAQRLYVALGGVVKEKVYYTITSDALQALASGTATT
ncbi:GNAT family N-acetyltransferase [Microvirga puerhi]|uniref:GNAT family N-acetyltransferase n=1 Tax=Microvirga puerhi TaxID=2876078 RepID=A0ABS7VIJ2_9HYPH|nr:GNAT family N-acetyltransferase [Microvirga puerhi]MBZ6075314.1 GNAT family N-acetyltransferase [Microvirga puerhi]